MILADGARPDVLNEELCAGNLPNLARHFAESGTNKSMTTVFPSTTGPAYLPYLTGCYPGTCNVPGIRWFDKAHYARQGWGFQSFRSYVGLESFLFNRDMAPQIKTAWDIFERPKNILNIIKLCRKVRFSRKQIDRMVADLRVYMNEVETAEEDVRRCKAETGLSLTQLEDVWSKMKKSAKAPERVARSVGAPLEKLRSCEQIVKDANRRLKNVSQATGLSVTALKNAILSIPT